MSHWPCSWLLYMGAGGSEGLTQSEALTEKTDLRGLKGVMPNKKRVDLIRDQPFFMVVN